MNVAVAVRGADVGLLVVTGRRQHDVGEQRRSVHAIVQVDDQVEVLPQRLQDVLVALGLVQIVGAPHDQGAWFLIALLGIERHPAVLDALLDVVLDGLAVVEMGIFVRRVEVGPQRHVLHALLLGAFGEGIRLEAALRPDALLADVVIEASAVLAGIPGKRHQQNERTVDRGRCGTSDSGPRRG